MRFEMTPKELASTVRLFSGSGGGKPLFDKIDLTVAQEGELLALATRHKGEFDHYLTGRVYLKGGSPGEIATNSPERLVSYAESGIFDADSSIQVTANDGWLELKSGGQHASLATDALDTVPKAKPKTKEGKEFYSPGPWGCDVVTDPKNVVASTDPIEWAKAGYGFVRIFPTDLDRLIKAAERLKSDYGKTVLLTFKVGSDRTVGIRLGPISSRDPRATKIDLTVTKSTAIEGSPETTIAVQYDGLDSMLASLKNFPEAGVALLYRPNEKRSNILVSQDIDGKPYLRLTQTFVHHSGAKAEN